MAPNVSDGCLILVLRSSNSEHRMSAGGQSLHFGDSELCPLSTRSQPNRRRRATSVSGHERTSLMGAEFSFKRADSEWLRPPRPRMGAADRYNGRRWSGLCPATMLSRSAQQTVQNRA